MKFLFIYIVFGISLLLILLLAVLLIMSISHYQQYWNKLSAADPANNAITYVALGDSAAQGIGATSPERGYVGLIAKKLAVQKGRPVHIINLSKTGAKIEDVLRDQIPRLNKYKADVITIEIGANDIRTFDATRFKAQAEQLFSALPASTIISDIPFFGGRSRLFAPQDGRNVDQANKILVSIAAEHHIILAPLYQTTLAHNRYPWSYSVDYFHPNNLGYQAWAEAFWSQLRSK